MAVPSEVPQQLKESAAAGAASLSISVIGCGYLGAVHAASMASLGHTVVGIDTRAEHVAALNAGTTPFHEPEFPELLRDSLDSGRLSFSTCYEDARAASIHFICVGTPQTRGEGRADLSAVHAATASLLPLLDPGDIVVGKSTVPVGTAQALRETIAADTDGVDLIWNPEFLREGHAVKDTLHPDRLVYGIAQGPMKDRSIALLDSVYSEMLASGTPRMIGSLASAELVKVAANSFLATKISFINAMAELCEATGADVTFLADAIGHDERIGRQFLSAGLGFGGGCLPKDIRAFMARAHELGVDQALSFLREVDAINMRRRVRMVDLARELCGGSIAGRRIAVLGATFKPNSDDVRDSPALSVAAQMQLQGAHVTVTDPEGLDNARRAFPDLVYADTLQAAVRGADVVMVLTEWDEYANLSPSAIEPLVRSKQILDGRNALDADSWSQAGWNYRSLGRARPTLTSAIV